MLTRSLFARLEAQPGKEAEVEAFLKEGLQMAHLEATTPVWFALRLGKTTFAIFDAFANEEGLTQHLEGPIARALMQHASELLSQPPSIERIEIIGAKIER